MRKKLFSMIMVVVMIAMCGSMISALTWYNESQPSFQVNRDYGINTGSVPGLYEGPYNDEISYLYHGTSCVVQNALVSFQPQRLTYLGFWTYFGTESFGPANPGATWYGEGDQCSVTGPYRYKVKAYNNYSGGYQYVYFGTGELVMNYYYY